MVRVCTISAQPCILWPGMRGTCTVSLSGQRKAGPWKRKTRGPHKRCFGPWFELRMPCAMAMTSCSGWPREPAGFTRWIHARFQSRFPCFAMCIQRTKWRVKTGILGTHTHTRCTSKGSRPPMPSFSGTPGTLFPYWFLISGSRVTRRMFLQPQTSGLLSVAAMLSLAMPKLRLAKLQKHMSFDVRKATRLSFFLGRCLKIIITKHGWLPFQHQPNVSVHRTEYVSTAAAPRHTLE